jgi:peroxiredoxin
MSTTNKSEITGAPRINDTAPDFTAETTQGTIHFHDWIGNGWAILFSHDRAGAHGWTAAQVRQAQLQDYRPERRSCF